MILGESGEQRNRREESVSILTQAWYDGLDEDIRLAYGTDLVQVMDGSRLAVDEWHEAMAHVLWAMTMNSFGQITEEDKDRAAKARLALKAQESLDDFTAPTGYPGIDMLCVARKTILQSAAGDVDHELRLLSEVDKAQQVGIAIRNATNPEFPLAG